MSNKTDRISFGAALKSFIGNDLTYKVYYQPAENIQMSYPAIIYTRYNIDNVSANNNVYLQGTTYQVVVIDKDPDSEIVNRLSYFPTARFSKHYATEGLNHDVFTIIYK